MSKSTPKSVRAVLVVVVVLGIGAGAFLVGRATSSDGTSTASPGASDGGVGRAGPGSDTGDTAQPGSAVEHPPATFVAGASANDADHGTTPATVRPRPPIPVTVTAGPTTDLVDGDLVDIRVVPDAGSQIYGVEARVCAGDASVGLQADFAPTQTGLCALQPLAPGADDYLNVPIAPPHQAAELSFRVGTGTDRFAISESLGGRQVEITCDRHHPCQLVLKLQVPNDVRFQAVPLTFA